MEEVNTVVLQNISSFLSLRDNINLSQACHSIKRKCQKLQIFKVLGQLLQSRKHSINIYDFLPVYYIREVNYNEMSIIFIRYISLIIFLTMLNRHIVMFCPSLVVLYLVSQKKLNFDLVTLIFLNIMIILTGLASLCEPYSMIIQALLFGCFMYWIFMFVRLIFYGHVNGPSGECWLTVCYLVGATFLVRGGFDIIHNINELIVLPIQICFLIYCVVDFISNVVNFQQSKNKDVINIVTNSLYLGIGFDIVKFIVHNKKLSHKDTMELCLLAIKLDNQPIFKILYESLKSQMYQINNGLHRTILDFNQICYSGVHKFKADTIKNYMTDNQLW